MRRLRRRPAPEQHIQPNQQVHQRNQPRALVRAAVCRLQIHLHRERVAALRPIPGHPAAQSSTSRHARRCRCCTSPAPAAASRWVGVPLIDSRMSPVRIPALPAGESAGTRSARSPPCASTQTTPSVGNSALSSCERLNPARTHTPSVARASATARIRVWKAFLMILLSVYTDPATSAAYCDLTMALLHSADQTYQLRLS